MWNLRVDMASRQPPDPSRSSDDGRKLDRQVISWDGDDPRTGGRLDRAGDRHDRLPCALASRHARAFTWTRLMVDLAASKAAPLAPLVKWWFAGPHALLLERHRRLLSHLWYVDKPDAWADPDNAVYGVALAWL